MSNLTLVGLGAMGSAIARTLIENEYDLTVRITYSRRGFCHSITASDSG
jgi:3-hydroxyisobutyrate dehydrogenase-like beta-hydroxyacid dehydrogenase